MLLRFGGIVVTVREIGPSGYGIFTGASAFVVFVSVLAQMGMEVYLIRSPDPPTRRTYNEAFTLLLVVSVLVTGAALALTVPLGPLLRPIGVLAPLRVLLLVVPLNVLWAPAQACIERQFGYRKMGILELGGDVALYGVAVPLALEGWGPWSLVTGYFAWQAWLFFGSLAFSGLRPRLVWSWRAWRRMLGHASGFTLSNCTANSMQLVVPLVVGTFAGAAGVGYVNFSVRLVNMLNFTRRGVFRIGTVAVSRVRNGGGSGLERGLDDGSLLVLMTAALPFAVFGLLARWIVPLVFGAAWTPAIPLYVLVAVASVLGVPTLVQRTVLYAVGRNVQVAASQLVEVLVLAGASVVLVPALGIIGFGWAAVLALVSMVVTHRFASRVCPIRYRRLALPVVALVPALLAPFLAFPISLLTLVPTLALAFSPTARREARSAAGQLRTALRGGRRSSDTAPVAVPDALSAGGGAEVAATTLLEQVHVPARRSAGTDRPEVPPPSVANAGYRPTDGLHEPAPATTGLDHGFGPNDARTARPARPPLGDGADDVAGRSGYWPVPADAVTGAASLEVMLARAGRLLGATRRSGWPLMVGVFSLRGTSPADAGLLRAVVDALRGALRFDDPLARAEPATFVIATPLTPGGADAAEVTRHLAARITEVLDAPSWRGRVTLASSYAVTAAHSAEEVDQLVGRAVEDLDATATDLDATGALLGVTGEAPHGR